MRIERIRVSNFRAFKDVEIREVPHLAIFVGANGTGKSTLFSIFGFLRDAMNTTVRIALSRLGGSRGFSEARSRNSNGPIENCIDPESPLVTYFVAIGEMDGKPIVECEILKYRRFSYGRPWRFLDFAKGHGYAVTNEATAKRRRGR